MHIQKALFNLYTTHLEPVSVSSQTHTIMTLHMDVKQTFPPVRMALLIVTVISYSDILDGKICVNYLPLTSFRLSGEGEGCTRGLVAGLPSVIS